MTNRAPLITAIVLLLLPVLYLGSYFALVVPRPPAYQSRPVMLYPDQSLHYRLGGRGAAAFYWPINQIDRKVRPGAWR
jgi:hypothetical protein